MARVEPLITAVFRIWRVVASLTSVCTRASSPLMMSRSVLVELPSVNESTNEVARMPVVPLRMMVLPSQPSASSQVTVAREPRPFSSIRASMPVM